MPVFREKLGGNDFVCVFLVGSYNEMICHAIFLRQLIVVCMQIVLSVFNFINVMFACSCLIMFALEC